MHAHYWTEDYLDLLADLGKADAGAAAPAAAANWKPDSGWWTARPWRCRWYGTVGHGHVPALRCAIDSFGADRLLRGTDFPYENGETFVRAVDYINDHEVGPTAARAILDQNATALLEIG